MSLLPNSASVYALEQQGGFPVLELPGGKKIDRPNREYLEQNLRWRWLLDSWEGGEKYRQAVYGTDSKGMPVRNLIRHKREYPDPVNPDSAYSMNTGRPTGTDQAAQATDDDYELRRARTPIPTFTREAIGEHLGKIYSQEIRREAPDPIEAWWEDVDGAGQTIDQWMAASAAPLLMLYGQLDFLVEHPPKPDGEEVETRADEIRLGLDKVVVSYILPVNIPWWRTDRRGRYVEVVVSEWDDEGCVQYRYWDAASWTLYDGKGKLVETRPHTYGVVPIVRVFDRKRPSAKHVGLPHYEGIAEIQREYYNRDSELILSDTTQAHPLLQGPEDFIQPDGTIGIGPNWLLPKKKNTGGGGATYEGFDVVQFPKDGAESIRRNKHDLRDAADRAACLTKPAGANGTSGQSVSQSGLSKQLDQNSGNKLLSEKAAVLERAEQTIAEFAAVVLGLKIKPDAIEIGYPRQFSLLGADELAVTVQTYQAILAQAGATPETEGALLAMLVRLMLPGSEDAAYKVYDEETEEYLEQANKDRAARSESMPLDAPAPGQAADEPTDDEPAGSSAPADETKGD